MGCRSAVQVERGRGRQPTGWLVVAVGVLLSAFGCVDNPSSDRPRQETTTQSDVREFAVEIGRIDAAGEMSAGFENGQSLPVVGEEAPYTVTVALRVPRDVPEWLVAEVHVAFAEPGYDHAFRQPRIACEPSGTYRICREFAVPIYHQRQFIEEQTHLELAVELWSEEWRGVGRESVPIRMTEEP